MLGEQAKQMQASNASRGTKAKLELIRRSVANRQLRPILLLDRYAIYLKIFPSYKFRVII